MGDEKTNMSEPLLTHRKICNDGAKSGDRIVLGTKARATWRRPQPGGGLCVALAVSGVEVA